MGKFWSRLATRLDTAGAKNRMQAFASGWPAKNFDDIRFFRTSKVQYRYRERGQGQTIVFSADPPVTLEAYDALLDLYSSHFRVVVIELPAMGFSATSGEYRFGWRETNDDLKLFLEEVAGPQAILAFSCVASLAAVDIAVRYPALVSKLVLMQAGDVAAFARWKAGRDPKGILAKPFVGQFVMSRIAPKRMGDWFDLVVGNRERLPHFCGCAQESFEHGALWSLASAYQLYIDPDIQLGRPKQSILAIWGEADGSHPTENRESAKQLSENVHYVALSGIGHFPELEAPAQVLKLILDFLGRE
ncbi:MAG: alpha/beta hydrolase [Aquisalinus sp.]|nr:alpha/beta hydrolase [Aquisalinus sp.]